MADKETFRSGDNMGAASAFFLFVAAGLLVFLPAMPYSAMIPDGPEMALRLGLAGLGFILFIRLKSSPGRKTLAALFLAFAVAMLAMTLSWQFGGFLRKGLDGDLTTMRGIALDKAGSAVMTLLPIVIFMSYARDWSHDFYWRLGRRGLIAVLIGGAAFFAFGFVAFGSEEMLGALTATWPFILLFVITNALMEEVLFRGLFLSKAKALMGGPLAVLATAIVFAGAHVTITYTPDVPVFLALLVGLGSIWAALILWSRSIWGSVVFHAGADLVILGGILETMQ